MTCFAIRRRRFAAERNVDLIDFLGSPVPRFGMGSACYACILRAFTWRFALRRAARTEFRKFPGSPGAGILVGRPTVYICFASCVVIRNRRFASERNADLIDFLGSPGIGF